MIDVKIINKTVHKSSGAMKTTKMGKKVQIKQVDGTTKNVILLAVKFYVDEKLISLIATLLS